MHRPPKLVLGGDQDRLVPPSLVDMTAHTYGLSAEFFPDLGHGLMLERDWWRVAGRIAAWLGPTLGRP
jgi:non-heme chloroperoxidase